MRATALNLLLLLLPLDACQESRKNWKVFNSFFHCQGELLAPSFVNVCRVLGKKINWSLSILSDVDMSPNWQHEPASIAALRLALDVSKTFLHGAARQCAWPSTWALCSWTWNFHSSQAAVLVSCFQNKVILFSGERIDIQMKCFSLSLHTDLRVQQFLSCFDLRTLESSQWCQRFGIFFMEIAQLSVTRIPEIDSFDREKRWWNILGNFP